MILAPSFLYLYFFQAVVSFKLKTAKRNDFSILHFLLDPF